MLLILLPCKTPGSVGDLGKRTYKADAGLHPMDFRIQVLEVLNELKDIIIKKR